VELVGVEHQPDQGLAVVRLGDPGGQAADVRQNEQPGPLRRRGRQGTGGGDHGDERGDQQGSGSHGRPPSGPMSLARAPTRPAGPSARCRRSPPSPSRNRGSTPYTPSASAIGSPGRLRSGASRQYQALRASTNVSGAVPGPIFT